MSKIKNNKITAEILHKVHQIEVKVFQTQYEPEMREGIVENLDEIRNCILALNKDLAESTQSEVLPTRELFWCLYHTQSQMEDNLFSKVYVQHISKNLAEFKDLINRICETEDLASLRAELADENRRRS